MASDETLLIDADRSWGKRHVVVILGFFGCFVLYALRVNMSVTIVSMTRTPHLDKGNRNSSTGCVAPEKDLPDKKSEYREGEFDWGPEIQSIILGSFFWGYLIAQIPGGQLAERFGSKNVIASSIGVTSILTLLTPFAARTHYRCLVVVRALEGLFEGMTFPSMHLMIAKWMPEAERGFMASIIYSGTSIGTVVTIGTSGLLIESGVWGGWPSVFYVYGLLGILWVIVWKSIVYDEPSEHPLITTRELDLIGRNRDPSSRHRVIKTPWKAIFTSVPVWALVIAHFGQNWGFYTLLFELPSYFDSVLGFSISNNGFLSALPYLLQAVCGWLSSYRLDRLIKRRRLRATVVRKLSNTIAFVGSAVCLYGVILVGCNAKWSALFFAFAMGFNGFTSSGFLVTHVDMSPEHAGTLMGITNCIASLPGFLGPMVVGYLTKSESTVQTWSYVFYICIATYFISCIIFLIFGSARHQKWLPDHEEDD